MQKQEYIDGCLAADREADKKKAALGKEYALSNSTVKVGHYVRDHQGCVKVEEITPWRGSPRTFPECVYHGPCYTKSGTPYKNGEHRSVYQSNIKA